MTCSNQRNKKYALPDECMLNEILRPVREFGNIMWHTRANSIQAPVLDIDITIITLDFFYMERDVVCISHRKIEAIVHLLLLLLLVVFDFYHVILSAIPTPWTLMVLDVLSCYLIWFYRQYLPEDMCSS